MASNRTAGMKNAFRLDIGFVGLLRRRKAAKADRLPVSHDAHPPAFALAMPNRTQEARSIAPVRLSDVLLVGSSGHVPKVGNSVVQRIAVDMVNLGNWPFAADMKPSESVRVIEASRYDDLGTAPSIHGASNAADLDAIRGANTPAKYAGFRVVVEKFAQMLRGKIGLSHDAPRKLIGQRPACVDSALRASSF